jgi:CHC2-type zinc finger protein
MTHARVGVADNKTALKPSAPARNVNGLRAKIDEAKVRLPFPELLAQLGLGAHAKTSAHCLWHDDQHPSFSGFKGEDGFWHYKCFVCDAKGGDEITFLVKHFKITRRQAITRYLEMVGFPPLARRKSREYPEALESPEFPVDHVYPVSEGHYRHPALKGYAVLNACTEPNTAKKRRWNLLRELKALESRIGRPLEMAEVLVSFDEWHRRSLPFLDPAKTRADYLAAFLGELGKVRVPWGEGETLRKAMENVLKLSLHQLPAIPSLPEAPETWRRLLALHRELSRLSANGIYFLSYRDAAEVCGGLTHQSAHTITAALETLGAIKIVAKGKAGSTSRKAAEFCYLLSHDDNGAQADHDGEVQI